MAIIFSIPDTEIVATTGQTNATVQDLVNEIRSFESSFQMMGRPYIIDATGKANLGGGVFTEIVMTIRNPWTVRFEDEATAHCSITGGTTLALDGAGDPRPVTTNPGLTINQSVSGTLVVGGSGVTGQDKTDIIDGVWSKALETLTAEEMMRIMLAALAGKRVGLGTATETYLAQDDVKARITLTPDQYGNGDPTLDGTP